MTLLLPIREIVLIFILKDGFVNFGIFGLESLLQYFDWHHCLASRIHHEKYADSIEEAFKAAPSHFYT